jgi:hypothetical protein
MVVAHILWMFVLLLLGVSAPGKPLDSHPHSKYHHLSRCGILDIRNASYILDNDVSSGGTCFSIQAANVTLNLNEHTVTYGTDLRSIPAFGVLGVACWDATFGRGNPCGGSSDDLTLFGGTITQDARAAAFSHGVRLGQGPTRGPKVHDVIFNISADSSIPIYVTNAGSGGGIYHNIIKNDVARIKNRHQLHGQSIKFADGTRVPGPVAIFDNHVIGGAQGGIFSMVSGTVIRDNVVEQNGTYTNDFGIYAWANDGEVYDNIITPISGRGIQIAASQGERVHDNKVSVIEQKVNKEYGGCQSGGTFGIQFDANPTRALAFGNDVLANADECGATALRVTESLLGSGNISHDNHYVAKRIADTAAFATGFGSGGATEFTSEHDTFVGDSSAVRFDWDGGSNLTFRNCVFARGSNPARGYKTFSFLNGGTVTVRNIHFIDSIFENGAAKDSTDMRPINSLSDWPGPAEYFIDWTLEISLEDQDGRPVKGVFIETKNSGNYYVFQGVSNEYGKISTVLTELKVYNTASEVRQRLDTPYSLSMQKEGCQTIIGLALSITGPTKKNIVINCSGLPQIPRR